MNKSLLRILLSLVSITPCPNSVWNLPLKHFSVKINIKSDSYFVSDPSALYSQLFARHFSQEECGVRQLKFNSTAPAQWAAHAVTHRLPDKNVIWGRGLCRLSRLSRLATRVRGKRQTRLPFVSGAFCISICSALVMNGGSCTRRGVRGGGMGAGMWVQLQLQLGISWIMQTLAKPAKFFQSDSVFPGSVDKQTNCLLLSLGGTARSRHSSGLGAVNAVDEDEVAEEISCLKIRRRCGGKLSKRPRSCQQFA